jgi:hypothetical protein
VLIDGRFLGLGRFAAKGDGGELAIAAVDDDGQGEDASIVGCRLLYYDIVGLVCMMITKKK